LGKPPPDLPTEVLHMRSQAMIQDVARGRLVRGAMLCVCTFPGCTTLTMGGTCVRHDAPVTIDFPRGRPYRRESVESAHVVGAASVAPMP
jgi:hypothetical protein